MKTWLLAFAWVSAACQLVPVGPSSLPARLPGESLAGFRAEDRTCRVDAARALERPAPGDLQELYDGDYLRCMATPGVPLHGTSTFFPPQPPLRPGPAFSPPAFGGHTSAPGLPTGEVAVPAPAIGAPSGLM